MNWINLNTQTLDSENFIGSEPIDRATWLCLLRYCIGQENSGVIEDCANWPDRKWQQIVRVTKKEATRVCDLWSWDGTSLVLWGYPAEKETEVQQKRETAKTNGAKGGRPKKPDQGTDTGTDKKPTSVISAKAEGEENGMEGEENGMEGEENGMEAPPLSPSEGDQEPASQPPLPEVKPTGRIFPDHSQIIATINTLRPEWARPANWSAAEMHALHDSLAQLHEMTAHDWELLKRFLAASVPQGTDYWQPRNRSKFLESFPDVFASAQRWAEKTGGHTKPRSLANQSNDPAFK